MGKSNVIIALGGGPSPVINSSLLGAIEGCFDYNEHIDNVYAAWHGIEGVLYEELIDMKRQDGYELSLLRNTPASGAVGTCRYKLGEGHEEDFERIIDVFVSHDVGYFFYIGGNDSMDTADKVYNLAKQKGLDIVVVGIPKTIDNDVGDELFTIIDHTPGYGSAARYWANVIQNTNEENRGISVSEPVSVLQAMGRSSGYITAASRLADPERLMPLQLYFAESGLGLGELAENVNAQLKRSGRCIVVVNEGFDVGDLGEARDGFGHVEYGASQTTVERTVVNYLNKVGLKARGQATGQVPGVLQRSTSIYRSEVDSDEAYNVARHAVDVAIRDGGGWMSTILRDKGAEYKVVYDKVTLREVANSERFLPRSWITADGIDVTDEFIKYARPLIGDGWPKIIIENGLQRFARIDCTLIEKKCAGYTPVSHR